MCEIIVHYHKLCVKIIMYYQLLILEDKLDVNKGGG